MFSISEFDLEALENVRVYSQGRFRGLGIEDGNEGSIHSLVAGIADRGKELQVDAAFTPNNGRGYRFFHLILLPCPTLLISPGSSQETWLCSKFMFRRRYRVHKSLVHIGQGLKKSWFEKGMFFDLYLGTELC